MKPLTPPLGPLWLNKVPMYFSTLEHMNTCLVGEENEVVKVLKSRE